MEMETEYVPLPYNDRSEDLAFFFGMKNLDLADEEGAIDTLCICMRDVVSQALLEPPVSTDKDYTQTCIRILSVLLEVCEPRRYVISFEGVGTIQQLFIQRQELHACQGLHPKPLFDIPGIPSCQTLQNEVHDWLTQTQLALQCQFTLLPFEVPGDGLYKIRQFLRLSPPLRCNRTVLYGKSNAHVLTVMALEDTASVELLYVPTDDRPQHLTPIAYNKRLFPFMVMYDQTRFPPPPLSLLHEIVQNPSIDVANQHLARGNVPDESYASYLEFKRDGPCPKATQLLEMAYARAIATTVDIYITGQTDNTVSYMYPEVPRKLVIPSAINLHPLTVCPPMAAIILTVPNSSTMLTAISNHSVAIAIGKMPTGHGPLPLKQLYDILNDSPNFIADGVVPSHFSTVIRNKHTVTPLAQSLFTDMAVMSIGVAGPLSDARV